MNDYIDKIQLGDSVHNLRDADAQTNIKLLKSSVNGVVESVAGVSENVGTINGEIEQLTDGYGKTAQDLNELTQRVQVLENKGGGDVESVTVTDVVTRNATGILPTMNTVNFSVSLSGIMSNDDKLKIINCAINRKSFKVNVNFNASNVRVEMFINDFESQPNSYNVINFAGSVTTATFITSLQQNQIKVTEIYGDVRKSGEDYYVGNIWYVEKSMPIPNTSTIATTLESERTYENI